MSNRHLRRAQGAANAFTSPKAFTLIELLVVIAIIAILAAILFPVFAQAREKARAITCLSNQKQTGLGIMMYTQDYDETYPLTNFGTDYYDVAGAPLPKGQLYNGWADSIQPYVKNIAMYQCPSAPHHGDVKSNPYSKTFADGQITGFNSNYQTAYVGYTCYAYNQQLNTYDANGNVNGAKSLAALGQPASTIAVAENTPWDAGNGLAYPYYAGCTGKIYGGGPGTDKQAGPGCKNGGDGYPEGMVIDIYDKDARRHNGGANYVFGDGHAKFTRPEAIWGDAAPFADSGSAPTFHVSD